MSWVILSLLSLLMGYSCQSERGHKSAPAEVGRTTPAFNPEGTLFILDMAGDTLTQLIIEIADNEFEQERGLMYRLYLPDSAGMLFIFPEERYRSFWMKNTHISLDIMYLDKELIIQTIHRNTVPHSEASVPSETPAQYVLEVNAGLCDIYGINEGMQVTYVRW